MRKRLLSTLLIFCIALTLLPGTTFAAGELDITDMLQENGSVSYSDLPALFSVPFNEMEKHFSVKNLYDNIDYHEYQQSGSLNGENYTIDVRSCGYSFDTSPGPGSGTNHVLSVALANSTDILSAYIRTNGQTLAECGYSDSIGFKNIAFGDSYTAVLTKLGLDSTALASYRGISIQISQNATYGTAYPNPLVAYGDYPKDSPEIFLMFQQSPGKNYGKEIELVFGENEKLNFVCYHNNDLLAELIEDSGPEPIQPSNYTFSYDLNGGNGTVPTTQSYAVGAQVTISSVVPTNTGFVFGGWSDGTTIYQAGQTFTMPSKNVTLRAQWVRTYTVSYDLNGGSGMVPSTQSYAPGTQVTITSSIPTRSNLVFEGWTDGSTTYQPGQSFVMPERNITLHARWTVKAPEVATVSYDLNGGEGTHQPTQTYAVGSEVIVASFSPTKGDAKFMGWSDGSNIYTAGQKFIMPNHDIVLIAQWDSGFPDNIYLKQDTSVTCTLATATMMVRRCAFLDGIKDWASITETNMKKVAWCSEGFIEGFTYRGITGGTESIRYFDSQENGLAEKKAYLISLLRQHPEGIGVYSYMSGSQRHAILLTDYDVVTDTFYCADPSYLARQGRIPLEQCSIKWGGEGQIGVLSVLHRIYYVAKDVNRKILVSSQINSHCPVDMVFSIDGTILDSRTINGTSENSFASMTVSGTDDDRNIEVQITGDYLNTYNTDVKLIGTGTGEMTFTVEHLYSDGSIERNIFECIPVSESFTATTASCYPQSSVVLSISDSSEKNVWVANPNKVATKPYTNFDNINVDNIISVITFDGVTAMTTNEDGRLPSLPTAMRSGYIFNGWYTIDGIRITTNTIFAEDITVYASWSKIDIPDTPGYEDSSSDSAPSYSIDLPAVTGGTIKAVPARASAGQPVTLTVRPNGGYQLSGLTVTDSRGNEVKLTDRGDGKYTFTMPAGKISLDVRFAEISAVSFRDVPSDAYYADAVAWAVKRGITAGTGDNAFSPDAPCTRAQIVTFLWRAAGSPAAGGDSRFTDVDPGDYYCDAVAWAVANGITSGTGGDTFSPDAVCTRSQAVTFLYRAGGSPTVSGGGAFTDVAEGMYYADAVRWAVSEGITAGTGAAAFSPDADCTRAQIVTFLYRDMA